MLQVICLGSDKEDLVVLNPNWLGTKILGRLLSFENLSQVQDTGKISASGIQRMFPKVDVSRLVRLLETMDICVEVKSSDAVEYYFPCFNCLDLASSNVWDLKELDKDLACGGIRIASPGNIGNQLTYVFSHVALSLHRMISHFGEPLQMWKRTCKVNMKGMTAIIALAYDGQAIEVECRAPEDRKHDLFLFCETLCMIIFNSSDRHCPGIYLQRYPVSPHNLKTEQVAPHVYGACEVLQQHLDHKSFVVLDEDTSEDLVDILAFGSNEIYASMKLGTELHISGLTYYARSRLAAELDPDQPTCMKLAGLLNIDENDLSPGNDSASILDRILAIWSSDSSATTRVLCKKLIELQRQDVVELLLKLTPIFLYFPSEDPQWVGVDNDTTPSIKVDIEFPLPSHVYASSC